MTSKPGFLDRTLTHLRSAWKDLAQNSACPIDLNLSEDCPEEQHLCLLEQMQACLDARGGDVAARQGAAQLGNAYLGLNDTGKRRFLLLLAAHFDIDSQQVEQSLLQYQQAELEPERRRKLKQLRNLLDAPRRQLLTQFNALPQGVKFLVDMRADMRRLIEPEDHQLRDLEQDLQELLIAWFDVGFLKLKRVSWDSPASLLEKLIEYEAVHEIRNWDDLKHRLTADRRLFAFFHPNMTGEPLIFIQVALVQGLATNIQAVLDETQQPLDPQHADTAAFYSISNAQKGLQGISFGNFLIKRVVSELSREFPNLRQFSTLSPIPGFLHWLTSAVAGNSRGLISIEEWQAIKSLAPADSTAPLIDLLSQPGWHLNEDNNQLLQPMLERLCSHYLLHEKRRGHQTLDPVAHFHLSNGARIEQLNWLADRSERGLSRSAGLMVNYLYDLEKIEGNSEGYSAEGNINVAESITRKLSA